MKFDSQNTDFRTGIQAGDNILYYKEQGVISILRPRDYNQDYVTLQEEGGDKKVTVSLLPTEFIQLLCVLTGLQAVVVQNDEKFIRWHIQDGLSIFGEEVVKPVESLYVALERKMISEALIRNKNNWKKAAFDIGISQRSLHRRLKELGIQA